ncbi:MAG: ABC transporter ATP-binding protein [Patescibacteria group bacterium]
MLKITNLKSGYNTMEVLKGLDFEVVENEIVAIIGPNGAGKSTLLKSIFNLCEIYSGKIEFNNKNITKLATHKLIYQGISYVPQGRQVFNNLTVKENLEMGGFIFSARGGPTFGWKNKNIIEKNINNIFDKFEFLKNKQNDYAFTLSGGQQQMLAIARALMQNPKLLLLDEPSLGLSPKTMKDVFNKIIKINQEGVAIIIVEQNAKQAVEIAHKTFVLEDGQTALTGGKEILKHEKIKSIYFGGR